MSRCIVVGLVIEDETVADEAANVDLRPEEVSYSAVEIMQRSVHE